MSYLEEFQENPRNGVFHANRLDNIKEAIEAYSAAKAAYRKAKKDLAKALDGVYYDV